MSPTHPYQILFSSWLSSDKTYTISEACDLQDILDNGIYPGRYIIKWKNSRTGNPVVIGRTGSNGNNSYSKKKEKKKKIINPFTVLTQRQIFNNISKKHSNKLR